MFKNESTQNNIKILKNRKLNIIEPKSESSSSKNKKFESKEYAYNKLSFGM